MSRRHSMLVLLCAIGLAGCASPSYYFQAIRGQLEIFRASRPLPEASADPALPEKVRQRLVVAGKMRDFASRQLGLPDNGSYRKYADIGRPFVIWNVFAAEPLSVQAKQWCFPIAGCVGYRGYFFEAAAGDFAAELRAEGYDVYVRGVPAYSTLGWFDDPILNTFVLYPDIELARLLFHELAHQVVYVGDDSTFNESFAVTVELAGLMRWLDQYGDAKQRAAVDQMDQRRRDFHNLIRQTRTRLAEIYAQPGAPTAKLAQKARLIAQLKEDYRRLRDGPWAGFSGYDRWFAEDINNATLASVGLYLDLVPAFQALLADSGNDLPRFYDAVRALASVPRNQRMLTTADGDRRFATLPRRD